jgi:2-amino-4-hydroxy-6-hydroxymethyldihydropteridine diphosphokinase
MSADRRGKSSGIFLGLGGNQGERQQHMQAALAGIAVQGRVIVLKKSSLYETEPWGVAGDQPFYYNAAVEVATGLSPAELLAAGQQVEDTINGGRKTHNRPRRMDIDILFYGPLVSGDPLLTVPHPRAAQRRFVLAPMTEIAPEFLHPVLKQNMQTLLAHCSDRSAVRRLARQF